ncbi:S1C family serine protease [Marinicrinis lubricantis]|uniref:S1C family serine protease n=1 Tax=Marinicrinis lubricantis TaxID=2086470 RepID=A0ABW1ILQ8_9BACL
MDDQNKRDPYNEFFERKPTSDSQDSQHANDSSHQKLNENHQEQPQENAGGSSTVYYAYGPYRSKDTSQEGTLQSEELSRDKTVYTDNHGGTNEVDVHKPKNIIYPYSAESRTPQVPQISASEASMSGGGAGGNQGAGQRPFYPNTGKKKSRWMSGLAAFLAGAVVVGGLMFSADYYNLFSGIRSAQGANASNTNAASSSANVQNVALTGDVQPDSFAAIVDQASPAVVKIETYASQSSGRMNPYSDDFFKYFFGEQNSTPKNGEKTLTGTGSGFIFDTEGYVLTNQHVVGDADEIYVTIQGYKDPFKAELLGSDYDLDLAVLKIEGDDAFPTLPIGNSDNLSVGDWLVAIGNPMGFDHTVSVGVLSQREREISISDTAGTRNYEHLLQTDASINPGNSGGPLLNLSGEVIGVNTAVSTDAQGIGFAIPSSTILDVIDQLKNNEAIPKPFIGVYLTDITEAYLENFKLDSTEGSLVTQLERGGPADQAGLEPGDFIIEVDGEKVKNTEALVDIIGQKEIGDKVNLVMVRDGKQVEAVVIVGDRSSQ